MLAEQQEEPGEGEPSHTRDAGEPRGQARLRQSLDRVEIEPRGVDVPGESRNPCRSVPEAGPAGKLPDVQPRECSRAREGTQVRPHRAAAAERGESGRRAEAADPRRARTRDRSHEVLEQRGPTEQSSQAERDRGPEQRVAPAETVEGREVEVEVERPSNPCRQGGQCLDLARVLAGHPQHDAARGGPDREVVDHAARQLLGTLQERAGAIVPPEGRQLAVTMREHGRPQVEATPSRQDDLGTLHLHGSPIVPPEGYLRQRSGAR